MAHVTALAQHILTLEPDKDAARLCIYHYLKNLCDAVEPVNSDLINRFFSRALTHQHWQVNKQALFQEVSGILNHFQETTGETLPLSEVYRMDEIQVVPAESMRSLELVVHKFLERTSSPYDQFRAFQEADKVVSILLQGDRSLRVNLFPRVFAIRDGDLIPLCQDFTLYYTPDLQLYPMATQQIEIGPHTSARFHLAPEGIVGVITRGYTFQKYATMDGGGLHRFPMLFYPLKRLEQFFVNRKSDPMYIELTGLLEKALELMNHEHPEGGKFAEAALERGRLALEHIFPDDKLVRLLINNLEKTLALESARRGEPVSNTFPNSGEYAAARSPAADYELEGVEEIDLGRVGNVDGSGNQLNQNLASLDFESDSPRRSTDEMSQDSRLDGFV